MTRKHKFVSAVMETLRRHRRIVAASFAVAMLLPAGAFAIASTPKETFDRTGYVMPLPPIRWIRSAGWIGSRAHRCSRWIRCCFQIALNKAFSAFPRITSRTCPVS